MSLRDKYLKWETWQFGPTPSDATVLATQLNWMFRSALLGFAVVSVAIILYLRNISASLGPETKESEYARQIHLLNATEGQINDLLSFVQKEKQRIHEDEQTLQMLRSEHQKLQPVVESERKTVQAILEAEGRRQAANVWWGYLLSFALGVISSMLATILLERLTRIYAERSKRRQWGILAPSGSSDTTTQETNEPIDDGRPPQATTPAPPQPSAIPSTEGPAT